MSERCKWSRCRDVPALRYLGRYLCLKHWHRVCDMLEAGQWEAVAEKTGIKRAKAQAAADMPPVQTVDCGACEEDEVQVITSGGFTDGEQHGATDEGVLRCGEGQETQDQDTERTAGPSDGGGEIGAGVPGEPRRSGVQMLCLPTDRDG